MIVKEILELPGDHGSADMPKSSPLDIPMKNSKIMQILHCSENSYRNANSHLPGQWNRITLQGRRKKLVFNGTKHCKTLLV